MCIDATEVTVAQYSQFLIAKGTNTSGQPASCGTNTSYKPQALPWPRPVADADKPMVQVDWCDAHAYCEWAGKRLCGTIGGGVDDVAADPYVSEWTNACTSGWTLTGPTHPYPYGDVFDAAACNIQGAAAVVGSFAACQAGGAYSGVFDLVGNVGEWTSRPGGVRGVGPRCLIPPALGQLTASATIGIRCCADPL